ncbi:pyridoxamine 5'-phosphate oxidase family protein [Massilia forsythiae]|uniref:Pyridoxamine 5'-phosphate oxidase family protein n=1 Tax=Massilia forsythiae TaxID=2728020 RepID=A0A7Z2ZRX0_9BURK|nr:pyridoxamine 5'-phosphate oxidase family protein [Massilia forsythiae]QJD99559.1 pyridoxamine 5'-phosphate oxidase family protein [Massilia forsythiae]
MDTAPSLRTQVRRIAKNASYDSALLHAIVDAAYLCHVAFGDAHGTHCIPTACWRIGGHLYIHGSNGSRMLKRLTEQECCVTITHLDGLVLARAAFNHSMNYRSAMIYGRFTVVEEADKEAALEAFMEHLAPGRLPLVRPGNAQEYAATTIMRIALDEAACKVRSGPPNDDEDDLHIATWAGVLPLGVARGAPVPDARCAAALAKAPDQSSAPLPDHVAGWQDR